MTEPMNGGAAMSMPVTPKSHRHHPLTIRKEPNDMYAIELRRVVVEERQRQLLADIRVQRAGRDARSVRQRFGASLIRLGRRVSGEAQTTPAWQA
jgi:hypothetical protein